MEYTRGRAFECCFLLLLLVLLFVCLFVCLFVVVASILVVVAGIVVCLGLSLFVSESMGQDGRFGHSQGAPGQLGARECSKGAQTYSPFRNTVGICKAFASTTLRVVAVAVAVGVVVVAVAMLLLLSQWMVGLLWIGAFVCYE